MKIIHCTKIYWQTHNMNEKEKKHISKFLSLVLRHQPEIINLILDENGWALVDELIEKSKSEKVYFDKLQLDEIVFTNDKQRFAFNDDKSKIRASQGHSVQVDLLYENTLPPTILFHGTTHEFMESIKQNGLLKMARQHIHLSAEKDTATKVGSRKGKPIILTVNALEMYNKGYEFYLSENKVWLTNFVPVEFINFNNE